ncbi:MAG: DUF447 family protein [Hyphomicrobiales bacterium]|nr:DUF447 family protein [Hyphomicrobiales bacterium]
MPLIIESIVVTTGADGTAHLAPLGMIADADHWLLAPFRPSTTLDNLARTGRAVACFGADARVYAGCLTGRRDWPLAALDHGQFRLADCVSHADLQVVATEDHPERPRFTCKVTQHLTHRPFAGHNRAYSAVIELAILVSRLHMLPAAKVQAEVAYLAISMAKTAGPPEQEAWDWLMARLWAEGIAL